MTFRRPDPRAAPGQAPPQASSASSASSAPSGRTWSSTAQADVRGLARVARSLGRGELALRDVAAAVRPGAGSPSGLLGQVLRFAVVGAASTAAFAVLYLLLRQPLGGQGANLVALLVTAVGNTWANRLFTFEVRGRAGAGRHHVQGLVVFALCWALTAATLAAVHAAAPGASQVVEVLALTGANLMGTVLRFLLLRTWVFRRQRVPSADWEG